jgi:hypothetical protein
VPHPTNRDPAEGSRDIIDRELARASAKNASVKNPGNEIQRPGGTPTRAVKGSAAARPSEPEGQQGSTNRKDH